VKPNGNAYPRVVLPNVGLFLKQRNERERFLEFKLEQKSNESREQRMCERVSEWNEVGVLHTPLSASI
jgi:hypothetical protein